MRIQELSRKTDITKRNIHFYIKEGLLTPSTDSVNGYYNFSHADYEQLLLIKQLRHLGLSISNIKSLLQNPASTEYYLRMHIGRLEQEMEQLVANKTSILSILEKLPVSPDFNHLYTITAMESNQKATDTTPLYDGKLVNHFLWRTFWEKENLSEYQQYLWDKMNRLTNHREQNEHFAKVYDYLCQQDQKKINALYKERNLHFNRIAELSEFSEFIKRAPTNCRRFYYYNTPSNFNIQYPNPSTQLLKIPYKITGPAIRKIWHPIPKTCPSF